MPRERKVGSTNFWELCRAFFVCLFLPFAAQWAIVIQVYLFSSRKKNPPTKTKLPL